MPQSFTSLRPDGIASRLTAGCGGWRPTLKSKARRTPSAQFRVCSAGRGRTPSHPRAIDASSRKEKLMRAFQRHSQQKDSQRETKTPIGSRHGTEEHEPQ
ncbi:hypothetical protein TcCL_ESM09483 [Trypanosoma cruzi]|nr:hypothetical protein TcCL_ESM09483 [Trypanosoma cruzi]